MTASNNTNGLFGARERKVIISHFVAFVNCRWRKDVPKWLFLIGRYGKHGKDPAVVASASVPPTDTATQADAPKGLCLTFAETTTALTDGKPITKLRFPPVAAIRFPTARFCVCPATKRPALTVDTDF